jgi:hypothetical protein
MTSPCNSIQLPHIDPDVVANLCRDYKQEVTFINHLQRRKGSVPRLKNVYICICDSSQDPCNALPQCRDATQGSYDILLIDVKKKSCEAVELKLDVKSTKNIEDLFSEIEEKFEYNCCNDYCVSINRATVFSRHNILKRVRSIAKNLRSSIKLKLTSLDSLDLSIFLND